MSLTSSLLIGRSALTASQLAIQVTGDNLANAATPGFTRRVTTLSPVRGDTVGRNIHLGGGVDVAAVRRQIDAALESRLRTSTGDQASAHVDQDVLTQIQSLVSELNGNGLASKLDEFLGTFSELANSPSASATRSLIVQQGVSLATDVRSLRSGLTDLRDQIDAQIGTNVTRVDSLLKDIASANRSIVDSEQGRSEDVTLRDRRDALLGELSGLIDISTVEQPTGAVDVYAGSSPLVVGGDARGLEVRKRTVNGAVQIDVVIKSSQEKITPRSGAIGGLLGQRSGDLNDTINALDNFAGALIFEVNKLHSSGRSFPGITDTTGDLRVAPADQTRAFNDPNNTTLAGLPFRPVNGAFTVYVTDKATGLVQQRQITVDLDGVDNTGAAGTGDDTSLASLVASLNGVPNVNAQVTPDGRLQVTATPGFEIGFGDDTSGALAVLGINTFFTGRNANDIDVRQELVANPGLVVAGLQEGSNEAALAIAALRTTPTQSSGGVSLGDSWRRTTEGVSVATRGAGARAAASDQVNQSLTAQRAAVSGVSVDEESLNLINYQRQYQAAARFISTVDQMTQILISLV